MGLLRFFKWWLGRASAEEKICYSIILWFFFLVAAASGFGINGIVWYSVTSIVLGVTSVIFMYWYNQVKEYRAHREREADEIIRCLSGEPVDDTSTIANTLKKKIALRRYVSKN